jgi:hypothetical protein
VLIAIILQISMQLSGIDAVRAHALHPTHLASSPRIRANRVPSKCWLSPPPARTLSLSCAPQIFCYSSMVFRLAGLANPSVATMALGAVNVLLAPAAITIMDRASRRTLLIGAWAGMCFGYSIVVASLIGSNSGGLPVPVMHVMAVIGLMVAIVAFAVRGPHTMHSKPSCDRC